MACRESPVILTRAPTRWYVIPIQLTRRLKCRAIEECWQVVWLEFTPLLFPKLTLSTTAAQLLCRFDRDSYSHWMD